MKIHLRIKNYEQFQHYRDRKPPWIKLYRDLWSDPEFHCLQDASKAHLMGLFSLASQFDNKVPFKPEWIAHQLAATAPINWQALEDSGFVIFMEGDASIMLANCYPSRARGETETYKAETETEKKSSPSAPSVPISLPAPPEKNAPAHRPRPKLNGNFAVFWSAYPRKEAKSEAEKAWIKAKIQPDQLTAMLDWLERAKQSEQWQDVKFIPFPATWLNKRRWEADPPPLPAEKAAKHDVFDEYEEPDEDRKPVSSPVRS